MNLQRIRAVAHGHDQPRRPPTSAREAAKYRKRLRKVEAERNTFNERLATIQKDPVSAPHRDDGTQAWR